MKLRYILPTLAAAMGVLAGCSDDYEVDNLGSLQLSQSYIAIPQNGGSVKVTVNAGGEWALDYDVTFDTDSLSPDSGRVNYTMTTSQLALKNDNEDNTWFTVSPANGGAGTTEITFTAPASDEDHESTIRMKIGDTYQNIVVSQKAAATEKPVVTVKDVLGGTDATTYRVRGTCSAIANTNYGNWYMTDDEGNQLYVYGTVDASGSYNWSSFGIELGDVVTIEGPRSTYNSTVELVDASVVSVTKALLQAGETKKTIEMGSDPFTLTLTQKGKGLTFTTNSSWLKFAPAGYTVNSDGDYVFTIQPEANNTGAIRTDTLYFTSTSGSNSTRLPIVITQLAQQAEQGVTIYDLAQRLTASTNRRSPVRFYAELTNAKVTYKSGSNYFIEDGTGGLCIYNNALTLKVGDVVNGKVWGSGYTYNGLPEATEFNYELATVKSNNEVEPTTVSLTELANNYDKYMSRLIRVENATVADAIDVTYTRVNSNGSVTDGTNTIALRQQSTGTYRKKNLTTGDSGTRMYYYFKAATGSSVSFTCVPGIYRTTRQLNIYSGDWLK